MNILNKLFNNQDVKLKKLAEAQRAQAADYLDKGED